MSPYLQNPLDLGAHIALHRWSVYIAWSVQLSQLTSPFLCPFFHFNHNINKLKISFEWKICLSVLFIFSFLISFSFSVTKFIGGHSDVVMGSISCNDKVDRWEIYHCNTSTKSDVVTVIQLSSNRGVCYHSVDLSFSHFTLIASCYRIISHSASNFSSLYYLFCYFSLRFLFLSCNLLGYYRQITLCAERIRSSAFSFWLLFGLYKSL